MRGRNGIAGDRKRSGHQCSSQIVVYPFATNPDEVTLNSSILQREYRDISGANADEQQAQIAGLTAQNVCLAVVNALAKKGYNALCQKRGAPPGNGNVLVVDGEFTDINEGNRLRRMVIGFGAGASVLDTNVYAYQPAPGGGQQRALHTALRPRLGPHAPYPERGGWTDDNVRGARRVRAPLATKDVCNRPSAIVLLSRVRAAHRACVPSARRRSDGFGRLRAPGDPAQGPPGAVASGTSGRLMNGTGACA
jgi:hypothetical protein